MDSRKIVLKETAVVAAGEVVCCAVMIAVFAALDLFKLLGGFYDGFGAKLCSRAVGDAFFKGSGNDVESRLVGLGGREFGFQKIQHSFSPNLPA